MSNNTLFTIAGVKDGHPAKWIQKDGSGYQFVYEKVSTAVGNKTNWLLTEKTDFFGNSISYHYTREIQPKLNLIEYSGYSVSLHYVDRVSAFDLYQSGQLLTQDKLLGRVEVKRGANFISKYELEYEQVSTLYSNIEFDRLASVTKCYDSNSSNCITPTKLIYQDLPHSHSAQDRAEDRTMVLDRSYYSDSNGISSQYQRPGFNAADVNNDGTPDFCFYKPGTGVVCALGSISATTGKVSYGSPVGWGENLGYGANEEDYSHFSVLKLLDQNADGYVDYCISDDKGVRCGLNNHSGGFSAAKYLDNIAFNAESHVVFETINQDKIPDICGFLENDDYVCVEGSKAGYTGQVLLKSSYAQGYKSETHWSLTECKYDDDEGRETCSSPKKFHEKSPLIPPAWIDINGDLNSDLCWVDKSAVLRCQLGTVDPVSKMRQLSEPYNYASGLPVESLPKSIGNVSYSNRNNYNLTASNNLQSTISRIQDKNIIFALTWKLGDLNSDGLVDLCYEKNTKIVCRMNTGDSETPFSAETVWHDYSVRIAELLQSSEDEENQGNALQLRSTLSLQDTNFDGLPDLCYVDIDDTQYCGLNAKNHFNSHYARLTFVAAMDLNIGKERVYENFVRRLFNAKTEYMFGYRAAGVGRLVQLTDLNADGRGDYCYRGLYGIMCTSMREAAPISLLTGVTDGFGTETSIEYKNLLTGLLYDSAEDIESGFIEQPQDILVVSKITSGNGVFDTSTGEEHSNAVEYRYQGAVYNPETKITGFQAVSLISVDSTNVEKTYNNLGKKTQGLMLKKYHYVDGTIVKEVINKHSVVESSSNKSYQIQLDQYSEIQNDLDGSLLSSTTTQYSDYDFYGNPGKIVDSKKQGIETLTKTTTTRYNNDTTRWLLSRAESQNVTHNYNGEVISRQVEFQYENGLLKKEIIEPTIVNKSVIEFFYDAAGNVWKKQVTGLVDDSAVQTRTQQFTFDALGRVLTETNDLGQAQTYTYDSKCMAVKTHEDIAGNITTTHYDALCRVSSIVDHIGLQTSYDYNWSIEDNQRTSLTTAYWNKIAYETTQNNPDGSFKTSYYDTQQRVVREKTSGLSDNSTIRNTIADVMYNDFGQKYAESSAYAESNGWVDINNQHWTTYQFDKAGRLKQTRRPGPDGNPQTITHTYNDSRQQVTYADYSKEKAINIFGKNAYVTENDLTVSYGYDAMGNLITTETDGLVTTLTYDARGNKSRQEDPSMGTWEYKHNAFGQLYWQKDAKGQVVSFKYDSLGRRSERLSLEGKTTWKYHSSGPGIGQLKEEASPEATRTFSYYANGALKDVALSIDDEVLVTSYTYDAFGRLAMTTQPDGLRQKYQYDITGQVRKVSIPHEDFTDVKIEPIIEAREKLFTKRLALQLKIEKLQNKALYHQAAAANYLMLATNTENRINDLESSRNSLLEAAVAHEDAAAQYRLAAQDYRAKSTKARDEAIVLLRYSEESYKYVGIQNGQWVFKAERCVKHRKIGPFRVRCQKHGIDTASFVTTELNMVDIADGSIKLSFQDHPLCVGRTASSFLSAFQQLCNKVKIKPYVIYSDIAKQFDALAVKRETAAKSTRELANKTTEKIPVPVHLTKETWVPVGISPVIFIPATISYTEYQMKEVSTTEAIAYYQTEADRYRALAEDASKDRDDLVADLAPLHEDLAKKNYELKTLTDMLEAYGIDTKDLEDVDSYLNQVKESAAQMDANNPDLVIWMATMRHADGQLKSELFGNGLYSTRDIDKATGLVKRITTASYAGDILRDIEYKYNERGQITDKYDVTTNNNRTDETFVYDAQGRVTDWTFNQTVSTDVIDETHNLTRAYQYDQRGNMVSKTDAGSMVYDPFTNRLTTRTNGSQTNSYRYDRNGNLLAGDNRTYVWTSFNKVAEIKQSNSVVAITYDANHSRVKKTVGNQTTYYVGGGYEMTVQNDGNERRVTSRHNIMVGHDVVATIEKSHTEDSSGVVTKSHGDEIAYYHRDILGSGDIVTNSDTKVLSRRYYTPYGESIEDVLEAKKSRDVKFNARVDPQLSDTYKQDLLAAIDSGEDITLQFESLLKMQDSEIKLRGFTSHEEITEVGLVNMNARLYDPVIGRFISADTIIPDIENPMAFNRYLYVYGNPVSYRDPDGHFPFLFMGALTFFVGAHMTDNAILQTASTMALAASIGPGYAKFFGKGVVGAGLAGGFTSLTVSFAKTGQINEDSANAALIAGLSAGLANWIGHGDLSPFNVDAGGSLGAWKFAAHGTAQGLISVVSGGSFDSGFISGVAGHFSGEIMENWGGTSFTDVAGRTMVAATLGGVSSAATGGSFMDGAMIAATVHLFNDEGGRWYPRIGIPAEHEEQVSFLEGLAKEAADEIDLENEGEFMFPWTRGRKIHKRFEHKVKLARGLGYDAEVTYFEGSRRRYGYPGGSRVDAIYGNHSAPTFALELKTGWFPFISDDQIDQYMENLPDETPLYLIWVK